MKTSPDPIETKGSALAFLIIVIFVMTLIVFSVATLSNQNLENVRGKYWEERARFGALAGVQHALTELSADNSWDALGPGGPSPTGDWIRVPLEGDANVTFSLQVENLFGSTTGTWAPDKKTWIPPGCAWINAVGQLAFRESTGIASIVSIVGPQRPVFDHAIFASNSVTLRETHTESWHPSGTGDDKAGVATNSIAAGAIQILDNSFVDGDVTSGVNPMGVGASIVVTGSTVTGMQESAQESKLEPDFTSPIPVGTPVPPVYNSSVNFDSSVQVARGSVILSGAGNNLTFDAPGNYYIQGDLSLDNGAALILDPSVTFEDPVVLYVDQHVNIRDGAQVNWNGAVPDDPRKLQIYTTTRFQSEMTIVNTQDVSVMLAGSTNSNFFIHESRLFGSVIAGDAVAEGSVVHYDIRDQGVQQAGQAQITVRSTTYLSKTEAQQQAANATTTVPGPDPPGAGQAPTTVQVPAPALNANEPAGPPGPAPNAPPPVPPIGPAVP